MTPRDDRTRIILMFDDDSDRSTRSELLQTHLEEQGGQWSVRFIDLQGKVPLQILKETAGELSGVDMILVDYILNRTDQGARELSEKGTSLVPLIKEQWPAPPVLAVTAAYDDCVKDISSDSCEGIYKYDDMSLLFSYIPKIIEGYEQLSPVPKELGDLLSAFSVPGMEQTSIAATIPSSVREALGRPDIRHHAFRWFSGKLHRLPGPLYDNQWASLILGIKPEYFEKYKKHISDARYEGIFDNPVAPRWWKSLLYSSLLPDSPRRFEVSIQEAAAEKLGISEGEYSICHRCAEKWPEIMALTDEGEEAELQPVHLRCSEEHSMNEARPFFEEQRVMLEM